MKIKILFAATLVLILAFAGSAQTKTKRKTVLAPNTVVKNLYAAQKRGAGPFFQNKSRARIDKYFTKPLADLIWKDATANDKVPPALQEVPALNGSPLFDAQDMEITDFKIGKPEYGEGNRNLADVAVTFKNFGEEKTVLFRLVRGKNKWKIDNIFYPSDGGSLKDIFSEQ